MAEKYVDVIAAAEHLSVSTNTIRSWVHARKVPFHKVGRSVRFRITELDQWVAQQTREVA